MGGLLGGTVGFLALLGVVALLIRLAGAVGRTILGTAEMAAAAGVIEASARRGDLTTLGEAQAAARRARTNRRRGALVTVAWALWLVLPLAFGGVREGWALAAPLWLLPRDPIRLAPTRPPSGRAPDRR